MGAGRPSDYSELIADSICQEISSGRSLIQICTDPDFPHRSTVFRWLESHEEFRDKYARAREQQAEFYASEIVALADTPVEARRVVIKPDGTEEITIGDAVDRTRLQIDARKWYASKLAPKKYGDKLQQEVTGAGGGPIQAAITVEFVKPQHGDNTAR